MFVEMPKTIFDKLKNHLNNIGVGYETSDCTIPGEDIEMVHLEMLGVLSGDQINNINNAIDELYARSAQTNLDKRTAHQNQKDESVFDAAQEDFAHEDR